jgi:hypothetical protein
MASYFQREKAYVAQVEDVTYTMPNGEVRTRQNAKFVAGQFPSQRKAKRWIKAVTPSTRF